MFRITMGKGFQMVLANGWTVSVQFGPGNYCDNRNMAYSEAADRKAGEQGSTTAEIAAWDAEGTWYDFGADTVKGYCSPDEVAEFIAEVAGFPKVAQG